MSSVGAIILSRMDSKRLPSKALLKVGGRPLLDFVLARCKKVSSFRGNIVLATSERSVDDPLADFARDNGILLFRGETENVAGRVVQCIRKFGFRHFARLNGDSPFLEPALIDQAVQQIENERLDFITNILPRSFPYGVSVEVVRSDAFREAYGQMRGCEQQEHVTKYLYENIHQFRYANITCPFGDLSRVRMTVDTPEDLIWFTRTVGLVGRGMDCLSYIDALEYLTQGAGEP